MNSSNYYPHPKKRVLASATAAASKNNTTTTTTTSTASSNDNNIAGLAGPIRAVSPKNARANRQAERSAHMNSSSESDDEPRISGGGGGGAGSDDDDDDEPDDDDDDDDDIDDAISGGATSDTTTDSESHRPPHKRSNNAPSSGHTPAKRSKLADGGDLQPQPPHFSLPTARQQLQPLAMVPMTSYYGVSDLGAASTLSAEESSSDESTNTAAAFKPSYAASSASSSSSVSSLDARASNPFGSTLASGSAASAASSSAASASGEFTGYSNKSLAMMQRMGFKPDQGLGKLGQGRIEPVEASDQRGRRGLGLRLDGLDQAAEAFDATQEKVELREPADWLESPGDDADLDELSRDRLESWQQTRCPPKMRLDDETNFVDAAVLREVLNSKSIFDNLGANDMRHARTRSNPFETIRGAIFLNRAAVKMANMDSMFDFMFTDPKDEAGASLVRDDDLLYFADVCAGPGGFSEYVLWRKGWQCKGFGFTLRAENDFKLHDFFAGCPETFNPFYGVKGDGNVFDPENIESLVGHVLSETGDRGVHFMMADGGFSVEGQENIQEILSKQLYLCQCLVALGIVRERGHFVVKLFDLFTPFSVGLLYLMYRCFRQICIFKPNTSRPANSERYLVCKWKRAGTDTVYRHLFEVNRHMWQQPKSAASSSTVQDFSELVDADVLAADRRFVEYVRDSNNRIGTNQIAGLLKIAAYCKDTTLRETRQPEIRRECLRIWRIPDKMRKAPERKSSDKLLGELLDGWQSQREFLVDAGKRLDADSRLAECFREINDWYFVAVDTVEPSVRQFRTMVMSKGGRDVLMLTPGGSWQALPELHVEITPNTLVYAEVVRELAGEGRSQTVTHALHIIDAIKLGGVDVRNRSLRERLRMCEKFALALNKPGGRAAEVQGRDGQVAGYLAPIRCKRLFAMRDFGAFFDRLQHYKLKDGNVRYGMQLRNATGPPRFYVPRGLLFFNEMKPYLQRAFSRSHRKMYFIDPFRKTTFFEDQITDAAWINASFKSTYTGRRLWAWEQADQVSERMERERTGKLLYRVDMSEFIEGKLAAAVAGSEEQQQQQQQASKDVGTTHQQQ